MGMVAFVIVLASVLSLPQGFAKQAHTGPFSAPYAHQAIQAVSNPTADCTDLGLKNNYGLVIMSTGQLSVNLRGTNPNSVYTVVLGIESKTGYAGNWHPLGSITTDGTGSGQMERSLSLRNLEYVVELKDGQGNVALATPTLTL